MKYEINPLELKLGTTLLDTAVYLKINISRYEVGEEQAVFTFTLLNVANEVVKTVEQGISAQMLGNGYFDNAAIGFACQVLNCSLKTI